MGNSKGNMDNYAFAELMLKWSRVKQQLNDIEEAIEMEVLVREESQYIGHTYAQYSAGRTTFGWEQAARDAKVDQAIIDKHSKITVSTAWAEVCKEVDIDDAPVVNAPKPKVTIKLREG